MTFNEAEIEREWYYGIKLETADTHTYMCTTAVIYILHFLSKM